MSWELSGTKSCNWWCCHHQHWAVQCNRLACKQSHYTLLAIKALKGINSDDKELGQNVMVEMVSPGWQGLWLADKNNSDCDWSSPGAKTSQLAAVHNFEKCPSGGVILPVAPVRLGDSSPRPRAGGIDQPGQCRQAKKIEVFAWFSSLLNFLIDQLILKSFERLNQYSSEVKLWREGGGGGRGTNKTNFQTPTQSPPAQQLNLFWSPSELITVFNPRRCWVTNFQLENKAEHF